MRKELWMVERKQVEEKREWGNPHPMRAAAKDGRSKTKLRYI